MTEIIIAGTQMHDVNNGRPVSGPENFDESFLNAMNDIHANPRGEDRQTIPRIMGRDSALCSKPLRFWLNTPDRLHPERRVWRFFFDVGRLKTAGFGMLEMRRCVVTGRRVGEFGGDPGLDNDGWGSDGGSEGGDDGGGDGGGDGGDDDDGHDDFGAGRMGGEEQDDGDDSNGGWGRGFGGARRRARRRENANGEDAGFNDRTGGGGGGDGDNVARQWRRLRDTLSVPSRPLTDEEAIGLVKRLQSLPKHVQRVQRSGDRSQQQSPTPSPRGIRKRDRDNRRSVPVHGEARQRPNRMSPATSSSDCEVLSVQRVGHEFDSPIDLSDAVDTVESDVPAVTKIISWIQNADIKPSPDSLLDDDNELPIERSDSPSIDFGGTSASLVSHDQRSQARQAKVLDALGSGDHIRACRSSAFGAG